MKISEVIKHLEELKEKMGDVEVVVSRGAEPSFIESVTDVWDFTIGENKQVLIQ